MDSAFAHASFKFHIFFVSMLAKIVLRIKFSLQPVCYLISHLPYFVNPLLKALNYVGPILV